MKKTQRGITLIELMISLVLGLTVVAGISELFLQSQQTFRLQTNSNDMTDDASYALEVLKMEVINAGRCKNFPAGGGYCSDFADQNNIRSSGLNFAAGEHIKGSRSDSPTPSPEALGDYFIFRATGISANSICTDILDGIGATDIVSLYIYAAVDTTTNAPVLYCRVLDGANSPGAQPIISNVVQMYVRYGVNSDADTGRAANYYTTGDNITITDWKLVVAVKLFLVISSENDNLLKNCSSKAADIVVDSFDTFSPTDCKLYKVFSKTVYFRSPSNLNN